MRLLALMIGLTGLLPSTIVGQDAHWETVRRVLTTTPLIDGHNDLPGKMRHCGDSCGPRREIERLLWSHIPSRG